jgi:hypothetical protein
MRMLVSVEFADAGTKSGTHRVLIIGRGSEGLVAGDISLSLEEAKTLISAIESEFVPAQAAGSWRRGTDAVAAKGSLSRTGNCVEFTRHSEGSTCRVLVC